MRCELVSTIPRVRIHREFVLLCMKSAARRLDHKRGTVSGIIVDDRRMAELHREFAGVGGTTDVLTFDLASGPDEIEGEIYVCLDQARRQAKEYGVTLREEIGRLTAHGVLHLAGYDDATQADREEMRRLEDRSLAEARRVLG